MLKNKLVTIRKDHQCEGCKKMFVPGVQMRYIVDVNGGFKAEYFCKDCDTIKVGDEVKLPFGSSKYEVTEINGEDVKLKGEMDGKVCFIYPIKLKCLEKI